MNKILTVTILLTLLISGCVETSVKPEPPPQELSLTQQHMIKGETLERENRLLNALEQYRLALSLDPGNEQAIQHEKRVSSLLWEQAQPYYMKGLELERKGQYEPAKSEYLNALQIWPEHEEVKKRVALLEEKGKEPDYIVHILTSGELLSKLGKVYYGDTKKYTLITEFNSIKDVTRVREGEKLKIPIIAGVSLQDLKKKQEEYLNLKKNEASAAKIKKANDEITATSGETAAEPETMVPSAEKAIVPNKDAVKGITQENILPSSKSDPYVQGIELFNQKKFSASIPLFLSAAKDNPGNETIRDYLFKAHFQQALVLFNAEDYLSAKDNFESALKYDKKCEKCSDYIEKCETTYKEKHYNLGIHYFGKEQLKKAIEEWELVKKIDPGYKELAPNMQKAEMLLKRLESIKKSKSE